jgi:hypothetical protein
MEERRIFEQAPYRFTEEELKQLSQELARATNEYSELKNHKATLMADLTSQLKSIAGRMMELALRISTGEEMRPVECLIVLDTPKPGMKQYIRIDNNEPLRSEPMSEQEQQQSFAFPEGQEPPKPPEDPENNPA